MNCHVFLNWAFLIFFMGLVGCAESPRAVPGFQPLVIAGQPMAAPPPSILPAGDPRRRAYDASLQGRICYYARVVDQDGKPVPNAMVLILLERLGWGTTTYFKCRTYTDDEGRFSIVGGVGTNLRINIFKKGYTTYGRSGSLKGEVEWELLQAKPDAPETLTIWKNIGVDRSQLIIHSPFQFGERSHLDMPVPLPAKIRFDVIRGTIAKEGEEWDIQLEYTINDKGKIEDPESYYYKDRYLDFCHITINQGKMAYFDDPLPEFARPKDGFTYRNVAGVVVRGLRAERLPYLFRTFSNIFQFQSRNGKVHGVWEIPNGRPAESDGSVSIDMRGVINPTGSPALFEIEPTEKDLSTEGYPLSE